MPRETLMGQATGKMKKLSSRGIPPERKIKMKKGLEAKYIDESITLTVEQKKAFGEAFDLASDGQKTYGQIVIGIMKKLNIDATEAAKRTGLNKSLFMDLDKPGGSIQKRFVVSIAVGFGLDVHMTEYILEACGMRFCSYARVDKAYIYIIESYKGADIETCNGVLKELGIEGKYMLGELERGYYKKKSRIG